jgi:Fur family transcriptional regulator, ferric uptake regulator
MSKPDVRKKLDDYLALKNLKTSEQRIRILDVFSGAGKHLTAEEIYLAVRKKYPGLGYATVYRTLKILCDAGICRELRSEDGTCRYEHQIQDEHHDHLICTKCGRFVEVVEPEIERLQEKLFQKHSFYPQRHRMELYGVCKKCRK